MKDILVVDDLLDAMGMLCAAAIAAFPSANLHRADSVAAALEILDREVPDLALVDLELGDGSGVAVIEAISRRNPAAQIVIATIHGDDGHLFPALRAGANGYLLKDQSMSVMSRQLRGIGDGQPPLSPAIARRLIRHFADGPAVDSGDDKLTPREREVLGLLAQGIRVGEIGERLGISRHTVGDHVKNIYRKLNISTRAEAALKAARLGLVDKSRKPLS